MKGAIIYKGKYGATRQYATWLGEELGMPVLKMENSEVDTLSQYDFLVLGASVYIGSTQHKQWLIENGVHLQNKKLFHFIVCGTPLSQKEKLEELIVKNIPAALHQPSSVWFLPGRLVIKKLSWKDRMMLRIGAKLEKDPAVKKNMVQDFDAVKKEQIGSLVKAIKVFTGQGSNSLRKLEIPAGLE